MNCLDLKFKKDIFKKFLKNQASNTKHVKDKGENI